MSLATCKTKNKQKNAEKTSALTSNCSSYINIIMEGETSTFKYHSVKLMISLNTIGCSKFHSYFLPSIIMHL